MASSIAQIMQSMRLEYIILSCELERGGGKGRREIGRDRARSVNEGKKKRVRERDENGKVQGRWMGSGGMGETQRMQQNRPIERRRLCKTKVLFILQLNGNAQMKLYL